MKSGQQSYNAFKNGFIGGPTDGTYALNGFYY